jgi:N-acetylneuraminic acid mutarotase
MYNPSTNTWTTLSASMTTVRIALGAASGPCQGNTTVTCLYAVGGSADNTGTNLLNSVEMYDPSTNAWTTLSAVLNTARSALGAASGPCQGKTTTTCLYAIGGHSDTPSRALSSVEMYSPTATTWTTLAASMTTVRSHLGAASGPCHGNTTATCLYAIGGVDGAGYALSSVQMYSPSTTTWTTVASLTTARAFLGAASGPCQGNATANCLYAIGGLDANGNVLGSVEMYTPSTNTWTTLSASMTTARSDLGTTSGPCQGNTTATCLYAIGGSNPSLGFLSSVEMYDPSANTWTAVASLHVARAGLGAASGPCSGNLGATCPYAIGGGAGSAENLVGKYDPSTNTWTAAAPLNTVRYAPGAASGPCQGNSSATCLYAIGGGTSLVEMYDPSTAIWTTLSAVLNTPRSALGAASGPCAGKTTAACLYAIGGDDSNFTPLSSVELYDPSATPTMARVRHFTAHRQSGTVAFQWRVPRPQGTVGFNLYAGKDRGQRDLGQRINGRLIPVHSSRGTIHVYRYVSHRLLHAPYHLVVVLTDGSQLVVAAR